MDSTANRRRRATALIVALLLVTAASAEVAMAERAPESSSTPYNFGDRESGESASGASRRGWRERAFQQWLVRAAQQVDVVEMIRAALPREAERLERCARHSRKAVDYCCGSRLCCHCEPRKREEFSRKAERALAKHKGTKLLLSATIGTPGILEGLTDLRGAITRLRGSVAWSRAVRIEAHVIEVDRVRGERESGARWNVHAHAVVIVEGGSAISRLRTAWTRTWARSVGARGSLDLRRWVRDPRWGGRGDGSIAYAIKPWRPLVVPQDALSGEDLTEKFGALRRRRLRGIVRRRASS